MPKREFTKVTSPISTAAYAWLASPDEGQEFSDGKFKVTGLLDKQADETKSFPQKIDGAVRRSGSGRIQWYAKESPLPVERWRREGQRGFPRHVDADGKDKVPAIYGRLFETHSCFKRGRRAQIRRHDTHVSQADTLSGRRLQRCRGPAPSCPTCRKT